MPGHAVQLPKSKITSRCCGSVQLAVVLVLVFCLTQQNDTVDGLPWSNGEKKEAFRNRYHSATLSNGVDYEDIIRARLRLGTVVGLSPVTYIHDIDDNASGKFMSNHLYRHVGGQLSSSPRGLGPIIIKGDSSTVQPLLLDESDGQECILGKAHHYMEKWLNQNGTINTKNNNITGKFLDLSHNVSTIIINEIKPFQAHPDRKKLVYLSLAYSGLNTVPKVELTLVNGTLAYLSLMGNILLPFNLPVLHNLLVLDLRHCGLNRLLDKAFVNTPNLQKLFLAHNGLTKLSAIHFEGLTHLQHLDLSYIVQSQLTGLAGNEQQIDPYNSLTEGLDLSEDVFAPLTNLTFLDVSHSKLLSYSARAFRNVAVIQLSLCYTGILIIVGSMMNGSLKVLDISGNPGITTQIHHEKTEARGFNANLEILVCENSTVKHLDWLNGMISLKVLLLGTNNINQLNNGTFANMGSLEILDLGNNHISNWHQRVFESNYNLFILDLSVNNINVLTTEMLYDLAGVEFLAIGQNSFVCHCLLREFIELAAKNSQSISCLLNGIVNQLKDSETENLDDEVSSQGNVLESTSTTLSDEGITRMRLTTVQKQSKNPKMEDLTSTTATPLPTEMQKSQDDYNVLFRVIHSYVSTIYHSSTKFQETLEKYNRNRPSGRVYRKMVDARMGSRFFSIDCRNRTSAEEDERDVPATDYPSVSDPLYNLNIQIIDFDEDSYKCIDLDNSEFYLFEQERCTFDRSLLENLNFGSPVNTTTANAIKFSLMFFGFALVAFIIYISKWEYIKYFCIIVRNATVLSLLKHKNESLLRKQSLTSVAGCYMYDVFVSYSEQDRQWVLDELLPNLEKTEDIAVCLHERDFQVGVSILENIIHCMDQSKTLLLVMSESFLLSHWCQFEMHLAQHRLLETRREQLILVLLEDIPKIKRSKTLQYLMKTKTYIIWPQPELAFEAEEQANNENTKSDSSKKKKKKNRNQNRSREKDARTLADERRLFWKRLRNAINDSAVWESDNNGKDGVEKQNNTLTESAA
ncbi:toll-like receptor 6 [Ochlerotatus camptorhynchus]|uniref:toll-like receptor 6 n=1 Tax=Ochlerotatus camptorhynchus TaxID=644619 RepID=UPI0031D79E96